MLSVRISENRTGCLTMSHDNAAGATIKRSPACAYSGVIVVSERFTVERVQSAPHPRKHANSLTGKDNFRTGIPLALNSSHNRVHR